MSANNINKNNALYYSIEIRRAKLLKSAITILREEEYIICGAFTESFVSWLYFGGSVLGFRKFWLFDSLIVLTSVFFIVFIVFGKAVIAAALGLAAALFFYIRSVFNHPHFFFRRLFRLFIMATVGSWLAGIFLIENIHTGYPRLDELLGFLTSFFTGSFLESSQWITLLIILFIGAITEFVFIDYLLPKLDKISPFEVKSHESSYFAEKTDSGKDVFFYKILLRVSSRTDRTCIPTLKKIRCLGIISFSRHHLIDVGIAHDHKCYTVVNESIKFEHDHDTLIRIECGLPVSRRASVLLWIVETLRWHPPVNVFLRLDRCHPVSTRLSLALVGN